VPGGGRRYRPLLGRGGARVPALNCRPNAHGKIRRRSPTEPDPQCSPTGRR
jgi:hypothetical protein